MPRFLPSRGHGARQVAGARRDRKKTKGDSLMWNRMIIWWLLPFVQGAVALSCTLSTAAHGQCQLAGCTTGTCVTATGNKLSLASVLVSALGVSAMWPEMQVMAAGGFAPYSAMLSVGPSGVFTAGNTYQSWLSETANTPLLSNQFNASNMVTHGAPFNSSGGAWLLCQQAGCCVAQTFNVPCALGQGTSAAFRLALVTATGPCAGAFGTGMAIRMDVLANGASITTCLFAATGLSGVFLGSVATPGAPTADAELLTVIAT